MGLSKVEKNNLIINSNNIPVYADEDSFILYIEDSHVSRLMRRFIPRIDIETVVNIILLSLLFLFSSVIASSLFYENPSSLTSGQEIFIRFLILAPLTIIAIMGILYFSQRLLYNNKIYILSEDYVIETYSGREEVEQNKRTFIRIDDLENVEVDKELVFSDGDDRIQVGVYTEEFLTDVQNKLFF